MLRDSPEQVPGYTGLVEVGRGRLGVVYRATHEQLRSTVAVKVLLLEGLAEGALRRFQRDCELTGRLSENPSLVAALDVGTTRSGRPYVAMAYHERGSLGDRLAREGPLPVEDVVRAGAQIARALGAAHAAGMLHRDVRPHNVLLSEHGGHALADFGIAALMEAVDGAARFRRLSAYHAAPEVLQGRQPSVAADLYSLGATLYHLLVGRPPYDGAARAGLAPLLLRVIGEGPPDIQRQDVPLALRALVRRAMAGQPGQRVPDAFTLADRLEHLQGELGAAGAESPVDLGVVGVDPSPAPQPRAEDRPQGSPEPAGPRPAGAWFYPGPAAPRPDDGVRPATAGEAPRSRRVAIAAVITGVLCIAFALGIHFALPGPHAAGATVSHPPAKATSAPRHPSPAVAGTPAAVPAGVLDAARPTGVVAADDGASVALHWQLGAGNGYPLFVQVSAESGGAATLRSVRKGSTTTTVSGLDPQAGYCFAVGAVVAFGQPAAVAWSAPVCIRGAVARPAG